MRDNCFKPLIVRLNHESHARPAAAMIGPTSADNHQDRLSPVPLPTRLIPSGDRLGDAASALIG
jgi:hypothetical protein